MSSSTTTDLTIQQIRALQGKKIDPEISAAAHAMGSRGGKARAASLTAEERRKIAVKAATKRWQGHKAPAKKRAE